MMLTAKRLRELLRYNSRTGVFTKAGKKYGTLNGSGYLVGRIDGKNYLLHRLAWLWMTGELPPELDHRNRNPTDNRFENLRSATRAQANHNRGKNKNNQSGFKGVSYSASIKARPWRATISANGKFVHLGRFKTKAKAVIAYRDAARKLHGEFAGV